MTMTFLWMTSASAAPIPQKQSQTSSVQTEPFHEALPEDWTIKQFIDVPKKNVTALSQKTGGTIVRLTNTFLNVKGETVQVNVVHCENEKAAKAVQKFMIGVHKGSLPVFSQDSIVVEFVGKNVAAVIEAKHKLFTPRSVVYNVTFDAVPIESCADYMQWNRLFNQLAAKPSNSESDATVLASHATAFKFGNKIALRKYGLGETPSLLTLNPQSQLEEDSTANLVSQLIETRGNAAPRVSITATVTSTSYASRPVTENTKPLTEPTVHWPSTDPTIQSLSKDITKGAKSDLQKIDAILKWINSNSNNLQFGGDSVGSRYGTLTFLKQRKGHCWDFSDLFISLCRSQGIPTRQVFGWLHEQSGHVWAEVAIDGKWHQFDPTSGIECTSNYIPLMQSDNGETPFVYATLPLIEIKRVDKRKLD